MDRLILAEVGRTPLAVSLPILKSLASPLTGIIPFTQQLLPTTDDARLFHVASVTGDSSEVIGSSSNRYNGGINFSYDSALAAAIGEGLERYAGAYLEEDRVRFASANELGSSAAPPESFALFHDRQYAQPDFPYARFTSDTQIRWTPGFRLPDGEPAFVPTQLTSLSEPSHGEPRLGYATSSGHACGATLEEAILSGLLELVERDAFVLTWYNALSLPRLDWSADALLSAEDERFYVPTHLRYETVDLSGFHRIPTALGVVRDAFGDVALAVGCASAPTMHDAIRKALRESFQTRAFARLLRADMPDWSCENFESIEEFEDHVLYYAFPRGAEQAAFINASPIRIPVSEDVNLEGGSVTGHITAILGRLAARDIHVYVVETTPPDLRSAGLRTAVVVAPELCRLDVPYRYRYFGGKRLYNAAFEAGLVPRVLTIDDLNPLPHPFP